MQKVFVFVDGFNLYHSLLTKPHLSKYKWLNIPRLIEQVYPHIQNPTCYYFTSLTPWSQVKRNRHTIYVSALESVGVKTVEGRFGKVDRQCSKCHRWYETHEEKETDVNIALHLVRFSADYDIAILLTGDSDQIPSIKEVRRLYPGKKIGVVIPIGRKAEALKKASNFSVHITEKHLAASLFPDKVVLKNGHVLHRPAEWRAGNSKRKNLWARLKKWFGLRA